MTISKVFEFNNDINTQAKILEVSLEFFARKGFVAVSLRDIAEHVGIKMASIYYYYKHKEAILDAIFLDYTRKVEEYLTWLSDKNSKAKTLEEVMDNMFDEVYLKKLLPKGSLGMTLAIKEQHNNETARNCIYNLFFDVYVNHLQNDFNGLIKKELIPASDTEALAKMLIINMMAINDIRVHEYLGGRPPMDHLELIRSLRQYVTFLLMTGGKIKAQ
jgi:AcrR family transcriptional regulator